MRHWQKQSEAFEVWQRVCQKSLRKLLLHIRRKHTTAQSDTLIRFPVLRFLEDRQRDTRHAVSHGVHAILAAVRQSHAIELEQLVQVPLIDVQDPLVGGTYVRFRVPWKHLVAAKGSPEGAVAEEVDDLQLLQQRMHLGHGNDAIVYLFVWVGAWCLVVVPASVPGGWERQIDDNQQGDTSQDCYPPPREQFGKSYHVMAVTMSQHCHTPGKQKTDFTMRQT